MEIVVQYGRSGFGQCQKLLVAPASKGTLFGYAKDPQKPPKKNTRKQEEPRWVQEEQTRPKLRFFSLGEPEGVVTHNHCSAPMGTKPSMVIV